MTAREKLDIVNYMIFLRGKLQGLAIRLAMEGEEHAEVDKAEERLAEAIRRLRVNIMQQWQGDADETMTQLRELNDKAQDEIRELDDAVNKVEAVANIVGFIDEGVAAVGRLVGPAVV